MTRYARTAEQNAQLGLTTDQTAQDEALQQYQQARAGSKHKYELDFDKYNHKEQVMTFPGTHIVSYLDLSRNLLWV